LVSSTSLPGPCRSHSRRAPSTELFRRYDAASDRIFSDEVVAAELEDIDYANAFLLGMDVGTIATDEEVGFISAFLQAQSISDEELLELDREDIQQRAALRCQEQLRAFRKGLEKT
jgi:predicted nucleotidyltransferase